MRRTPSKIKIGLAVLSASGFQACVTPHVALTPSQVTWDALRQTYYLEVETSMSFGGGPIRRLEENCSDGQLCEAHLSRHARDAWDHPIWAIESLSGDITTQSAGPDGVLNTADDISFSPVDDSVTVANYVGCYVMNETSDRSPVYGRFELQRRRGTFRYHEEVGTDGRRGAWIRWKPITVDSIMVINHDVHGSVEWIAGIRHDTLSGRGAGNERLVAVRVTCAER